MKERQAEHQEGWASRVGLILAVASGAIGLGNFCVFQDKRHRMVAEHLWFPTSSVSSSLESPFVWQNGPWEGWVENMATAPLLSSVNT